MKRCDNCGYFTDDVEKYEYSYLCSVCAFTFLNQPEPGADHLSKSIGWIVNALIDSLNIRDTFENTLEKQTEYDNE